MYVRAAIVSTLAAVVVLTAGCGAVGHLSATAGSPERGASLFKSNCGSCHTLAAASTAGTIGPNLDAAFGPTRCQKVGDESTIRDVVRGQIAYPETDTGSGAPGMPANILRGQEAKDVSAYVASVAGVIGTSDAKKPYWDCNTGTEVS